MKSDEAQSAPKRTALAIAYNALMAIGCIDDSLHSQMWCFGRAQQIANAAMRDVDHTQAVAKAIGLRGKRGLAGRTELMDRESAARPQIFVITQQGMLDAAIEIWKDQHIGPYNDLYKYQMERNADFWAEIIAKHAAGQAPSGDARQKFELGLRRAKFTREEFPIPTGLPQEIYPQIMAIYDAAGQADSGKAVLG